MKNKISLLLFVLVFAAFAATGCKNTAHGAGEDIEKIGDKIQEKTK